MIVRMTTEANFTSEQFEGWKKTLLLLGLLEEAQLAQLLQNKTFVRENGHLTTSYKIEEIH